MTGEAVERANLAGTAVFVVGSAVAVVAAAARPIVAAIDLALFAVGCAAFLAAYARAVGRSRTDDIAVASLFFLSSGVAPAPVRRRFMAALAVQVVVALAAASLRPFTPLAFGVLVPVFGLGLAGLWGSRHGSFAARPAPPTRPGGAVRRGR